MSENTEGGAAKKDAGGLLIVQSKVRDLIREREKRVSDEFINALSEHVRQSVEKAVQRATANGRSTLRPEDI
jgi:histone H3/H4